MRAPGEDGRGWVGLRACLDGASPPVGKWLCYYNANRHGKVCLDYAQHHPFLHGTINTNIVCVHMDGGGGGGGINGCCGKMLLRECSCHNIQIFEVTPVHHQIALRTVYIVRTPYGGGSRRKVTFVRTFGMEYSLCHRTYVVGSDNL